jgi:hypothetical protein
MTSASWGVEREFVEVNEHEAFPLATPKRSHIREFRRLMRTAAKEPLWSWQARLDSLVFDMYDIDDVERDRVLRAMTDSLGRYHRPLEYSRPIDGPPLDYMEELKSALSGAVGDLGMNVSSWRDGTYQIVVAALGGSLAAGHAGEVGDQVEVDIEAIVAAQSSVVGFYERRVTAGRLLRRPRQLLHCENLGP